MTTPLSQPGDTIGGLRGNLSTFLAMVRKEFTIMLRYPVEFVASFGQIFLIIAVFSLAAAVFAGPGRGGDVDSGTAGVVIYGFTVFIFVSDTLWSIGFNVRREQTQGTLEQLYLSPAPKLASLGARVAIVLLWTGLLAVASAFVMGALLGSMPFHRGGLGLAILALTLAGTFGTGFAFAALTLRIKQAAATAANLLQFAFMILCAPFFPFAALPAFLLPLVKAVPLAYGVDAFRSTLMDYPSGFPELAPLGTELLIITLFGLLMPFLGIAFYRRAEDRARRRGSLSEY